MRKTSAGARHREDEKTRGSVLKRWLCLAVGASLLVSVPRAARARWFSTMPPVSRLAALPEGVSVSDSIERLRNLRIALVVKEDRLGGSAFDADLRRSIGALYLLKARETEAAADYQKADTQFRAVVGLFPHDWRARVGLARALAGRDRFDEASVQAREAAVYGAGMEAVVELIGDLHFERGDMMEAESVYRGLLAKADNLRSLARMALVQEAVGHHQQSERTLANACEAGRRGKTASSSLVWCLVTQGESFLSHGRLDEALQWFARALGIDPSAADALWGKARVAFRRGKADAAQRDLSALAKRFSRPRYLWTLAAVLGEEGRDEAAAEARTKARESLASRLAAGNLAALGPYAVSLLQPGGDSRLAVQSARRQVDEVRHDAGAYATLAWALYGAQRFEEAVAAIERALATGSDDPSLVARAGMIYVAVGASSQASSYLTRALAVPTALRPALARRAKAELARIAATMSHRPSP